MTLKLVPLPCIIQIAGAACQGGLPNELLPVIKALARSGTPKVGDPVAPIQFVIGIPKRDEGLCQSANVVLDESSSIDENHAGMDLFGQRPAFEQTRNGPLVVGDQSEADRACRAQTLVIVFAEMGSVFPGTQRQRVNLRAMSPDNRRDRWIEMFVKQQGKQGSAGPTGVRKATSQFFFANRIVLRHRCGDFRRISANVRQHSLRALPRPSQVGRRSRRIERIGLGHHQHFPNRERRTHHVSLPPHDRVSELDRRKFLMPQSFLDQLGGGLAARFAHTAGEAVQAGRLFVGQLEVDQGHASFIVVTPDGAEACMTRRLVTRPGKKIRIGLWQNDDITAVTVRRNA